MILASVLKTQKARKKLGTASESGLRRRGYLITGSIKHLQGPVVQDLPEYFLPVC